MRRRHFFLAFVLAALFIVVIPQVVVLAARSRIVDASSASEADAIIVLGASVLRDGTPSDILEDRLLTGIALYEAGKGGAIIVSGDDGQEAYDEVNAMRVYLLAAGIPAEDIFLDHAGFDTFDSMYRAKAIFGVERAIVVTQNYHLPRALYLAGALGIDVQGVVADRQPYLGIRYFTFRERIANVKAVFNILLHSKPKYLGDPIDIHGDGTVTWDEGVD